MDNVTDQKIQDVADLVVGVAKEADTFGLYGHRHGKIALETAGPYLSSKRCGI